MLAISLDKMKISPSLLHYLMCNSSLVMLQRDHLWSCTVTRSTESTSTLCSQTGLVASMLLLHLLVSFSLNTLWEQCKNLQEVITAYELNIWSYSVIMMQVVSTVSSVPRLLFIYRCIFFCCPIFILLVSLINITFNTKFIQEVTVPLNKIRCIITWLFF